MKHLKSSTLLILILICIILMTSCSETIETISPGSSEIIESVLPSPIESPSASLEPSPSIELTPTYTFTPHPSQTVHPSPSIEPTPTYTFTPPPSPTPTPVPEKPEAFTPERYFTFDEATGTITGYKATGGTYVSIPNNINGVNVERIGKYAFARINLYGVIIPEGVVEIQKGAFYYCFLEEVEIPESVKRIADRAFYVNNLKSVDLPDKLEYLGEEAFFGNKLTKVVIPDSLSRLETKVFYSNFIETLEIPASISYIGDYAFASNKLTNLILHDGIGFIGEGAFSNNELLSVKLPASLSEISAGLFSKNYLTTINISSSITKIGSYAFSNNKLTSLILHDGISFIGERAFSSNELLTVKLPVSLSEISAGLFSNNNFTDINISSSINKIGSYAFYSNKLTHIDISDSIVYIGSYAFDYNNLVEVRIPDNVQIIERSAFANNTIENVQLGKGISVISESAFNSNNIKTLHIPDNITSIGNYAFSNNKIESLTIGPNVEVIGAGAFRQNILKSVIFPSKVSVINDETFRNNEITDITLYGDVEYISDTAFDENESISAACIKGTYTEYLLSKIGMQITGLNETISIDRIPYTREDIIQKNISFHSTDKEVLLAEKWIWEYLMGIYGNGCILKSFSANADSDIVDSFICPDNKVFIKKYDVTYDYIKDNNVITEEKTMQLVIIRNSDNINVLSGIAEPSIDFNNKYELHDYLSLDNRFTYWAIPDKSVQITLEGDIAFSDYFPDGYIGLQNSLKFEFPGTDYVLVEEEGNISLTNNIYLKNTKTGEMKLLLESDPYYSESTLYKAYKVIDSERFLYYISKFQSGIEGMGIYNITDDTTTLIYYPEHFIYMVPQYTDDKSIIIADMESAVGIEMIGLYKTSFFGDDAGKLEQITDNIFSLTEFIVSNDNKYLVYKLWKENSSDVDSPIYIVSDNQIYIKTVIKVVDLTKGEIVKVGTIYEEVTQSGLWSEADTTVSDYYSYRNNQKLAFDEAGNVYVKSGNNNFVIATH
ncbi:MAG: leucine-rich repeat domain-containing protein [Clostridia bacterium]